MKRVTGIGRWAGMLGMVLMVLLAPGMATAAPGKAQLVMDMRSGKVLYSRGADRRLHPASLTKMMTLYIAFEALKTGELTEMTRVRISKNAAGEEPSKIGYRPGARVEFQYLIRAAAVKSANDAATAIAEAVSGSESAFIARMNRTAKRLGMKNTTFRNAHGLTAPGHLSTARDMAILGRHLYFDYPGYWHLFSRLTADVKVKTVRHTNRRLLNGYAGADGLKTGYTRAAGWNLAATAERDGVRIITIVFGEANPTERHARVTKLLDLGFDRAPRRTPVVPPRSTPRSTLMAKSPRPAPRPGTAEPAPSPVAPERVDALVAEVVAGHVPGLRPRARPAQGTPPAEAVAAVEIPAPVRPAPEAPPDAVDAELADLRVVTRATRQAPQTWSTRIGPFGSEMDAQSALLRINLSENRVLEDKGIRLQHRRDGFDILITSLSEKAATGLCTRLMARSISCLPEGPG